jgi:hypothetical protein
LSCFAAFAYVKKLFARDFYRFSGRFFISAEEHGDVRGVERPGGIKGFEGRSVSTIPPFISTESGPVAAFPLRTNFSKGWKDRTQLRN